MLLLFLVLKSQILEVRESVDKKYEEGFEEDRIQTFRFTQKEIQENLRWEHDREFEYQGQMFDVIERKTLDGLVELTVYADHEETELKIKMAHLLQGELEDEPCDDQRIRTDFHYQLFQSTSENWVSNPNFIPLKKMDFNSCTSLSYLPKSPPTPPPNSLR